MTTLWQLKNKKTNEKLNDPQPLPENWGPIFGMENVKEKLNDLSWVGIPDLGWFEVGTAETNVDVIKKNVDSTISQMLSDSLEMVAADNTSITKGKRAEWIEYRRLLKEIKIQPDYPKEVNWPKRPD